MTVTAVPAGQDAVDREDSLDDAVREPMQKAFPRVPEPKREAVIAEIVQRVLHLPVFEVEVIGTRMPVETLEAYGLVIEVDANGRAARVVFPDGAEPEAM